MRDDSSSGPGDGRKKKPQTGRKKKQIPSNDPQEAMRRWTEMLETGQERVFDLKTKTILALDNLFAGGFMQEGQGAKENDMLPVLRKFLMNDFEGYSPPRAQVSASLLDDFENFGVPQALTAPSLDDGKSSFEAGGADVAGWGRLQQAEGDIEEQLDLLKPLDRVQFSQAVQSGLSEMAAEDIDMVFDDIDKDGDGTLTWKSSMRPTRQCRPKSSQPRTWMCEISRCRRLNCGRKLPTPPSPISSRGQAAIP